LAASFFSELKRRSVFKVGTAYLILGWVVLQVADLIVPRLALPEWTITFLLVVGLLGFPFALFFAWVFEMTPEGVKRESEIAPNDGYSDTQSQQGNLFFIAMLVLIIGFIGYWQFFSKLELESDNPTLASSLTSTSVQKSIAVLPFINMSNDTSQEYFSDGITEEILNVLAKNKKLLVAARTSAFSYKGKNVDIRTIGKELGVEHILEGSVRKAGDELRITAQLIRVKDGFHLWSETYDRKLENIFVLQEDIAKDISNALAVPLGIKTEKLITSRTHDIEAYELFLKGRALVRKRGASIGEAANLMAEVIEKEPQYAPARALYSVALNYIPGYLDNYNDEPINKYEMQAKALENARIAVRLDPSLAMGHYALANAYREGWHWALAEEEYEKAYAISPNNIDIIEDYSQFFQVVGRLNEAEQIAKIGYELEPNAPIAILNYADKLFYGHINTDYEKIEKLMTKVLTIQPDSVWVKITLSGIFIKKKQYQKAIDIYNNCQECMMALDVKSSVYYLEQLVDGSNPIENELPLQDTLNVNIVFAVGGIDAVFDVLEKPSTFDTLIYLEAHFMKTVRQTERFKTITKYLGLADYWRLHHWPDFCHPTSDTDFECN